MRIYAVGQLHPSLGTRNRSCYEACSIYPPVVFPRRDQFGHVCPGSCHPANRVQASLADRRVYSMSASIQGAFAMFNHCQADLRSEEGDECSLFSSAVAARTTSSTGSSASLRPYKRADISTTFVEPVTRAVSPAVARKPPLIHPPNSPSSIPAPSRAS